MKTNIFLNLLLSAGLGIVLNSCSNPEDVITDGNQTPQIIKSICVTLPDSPFGDLTRTAHSIVSGSMHTDWQEGDILGIYPIGGDQVAFPISEGEGTNEAKFDGGSWALRASYQYAAYYPFSTENYTVKETQLSFDYSGQEQDDNGSLDHLGTYDFLAAGATTPNEKGGVDLTLNHLGSFVRMQLTIPEANTLKSVRVSSNNTQFITKGSVDLSSATPAIVATQTSSFVELNLKDIVVEAGNVVTLYMMMAPVNLSGSVLTFTVSGNGGVFYRQTLNEGKNMKAGSAYNYAVSLDKDDSQYEAVDLGLPSGLKWASFNVGATAPEEYGDYYAWGEVTTKDKFSYANYEHLKVVTSKDADGFDFEEQVWADLGEISATEYDVAHQKWGGSWRMPTLDEFEELCKCCTWKWGAMNTVNGYKVTGANGNWIFLPAAGNREDRYFTANIGCYWSSTLNRHNPINGNASQLFFYNGLIVQEYSLRHMGRSVRPVTE